ncbi:MAG: hypothetical protein HY578_06700 [Nitrospinae bacterium]|nr:hypothetical protein [Nitrospinota bacterium]
MAIGVMVELKVEDIAQTSKYFKHGLFILSGKRAIELLRTVGGSGQK